MASLVPIKLAKLSFKVGGEECQLSPLLSILTDDCYATGLIFLCLTSLMALNGFYLQLVTYFTFRFVMQEVNNIF